MKYQTLIIALLALNFSLMAQPTAITWQGKLIDNNGDAITQNNVAMTFAMYDASTGSTQLWPVSGVVTKTVDVEQGLYSVQLGTGAGDDIAFTAAMFEDKTPWLEVKVGTETMPRTEITNVPFAFFSNNLSASGWGNPGEIGKTTPNTGKFTSVETGTLKVMDGASAGKVLTSDADGNAGWENTKLANFEESNYQLNSKTGVKLKAANPASDLDLVISPKGAGAILAQQPDSLISGGISRGLYAVDLQMYRIDSTQVASGNYATISGGANNTASGDYSAASGIGTTASGPASTAMGAGTIASGVSSTAMGFGTTASGTYSTALGFESSANSVHSIAMGIQSTSSGGASIAIGGQDTASGGGSVAIGYQSIASGITSMAMGNTAKAKSENAVAIGNGTVASGIASTALGDHTNASGTNATALGAHTIASGTIATALGSRTNAPSAFETVIGRYNTDYTPASTTQWFTSDRLFVVGNGIANDSRSNAITILKNANTTIGGTLAINANGTNTGYTFPAGRGTNGQVLQTDGSGNTNWVNAVKTYQVGDFAQGGIVFWVDETGQHGLICDKEDLDGGSGIRWNNGTDIYTETNGSGIYSGEMNTTLIIASQGHDSNDYAAGICANLLTVMDGVGYGDWYLPSGMELKKMYLNKATIDSTALANGGSIFTTEFYWSSNELYLYYAIAVDFGAGQGFLDAKFKSDQYRVRAIRSF